jgi:phage shock protein A
MGIFTRFRDIISANLNAMLDHAEDPEKMVRLMIQEMEDTLIEVKASCAGVIADLKKLERMLNATRADAADWDAKARLAVEKERDDLARAALAEKRRLDGRVASLQNELEQTRTSVAGFKEDIAALESKLADAREKQRTIVQRRAVATSRLETARRIRTIDTSEAFVKFEAYENGIDRLEAEAGLTDSLRPRRGGESLRDQFATLEQQEDIERELERLKNEVKSGPGAA